MQFMQEKKKTEMLWTACIVFIHTLLFLFVIIHYVVVDRIFTWLFIFSAG
jgi:hypothetical protein